MGTGGGEYDGASRGGRGDGFSLDAPILCDSGFLFIWARSLVGLRRGSGSCKRAAGYGRAETIMVGNRIKECNKVNQIMIMDLQLHHHHYWEGSGLVGGAKTRRFLG
jgi:hypothetical protein